VPTGDYDLSGILDVLDLDRLRETIRLGSYSASRDLNRDKVLNQLDLSFWLRELKHTWVGDANLDGAFSSMDLVSVFEAGHYEDLAVGNSTWATGDWNADGDFTSGDLLEALADGGYDQGPRAAAAVSEPSGALVLVLGMLVLSTYRYAVRYHEMRPTSQWRSGGRPTLEPLESWKRRFVRIFGGAFKQFDQTGSEEGECTDASSNLPFHGAAHSRFGFACFQQRVDPLRNRGNC
jgi:hypothetical protein